MEGRMRGGKDGLNPGGVNEREKLTYFPKNFPPDFPASNCIHAGYFF